ncbi:AlbA family DNA-binding domain-containing protein [Gracilimonas sp.]|uniref:AlbA family DNA-binding domain-containing protein n=1 Tax=Gracilimonas sp. TaxID=1974203 RepID=UPI003D13E890
MKIDELRNIISKGESTRIEYKECSDRVPSSMYETVASFSNTDGGTMLLGVNDDQEISGINEGAGEKLKNDIITALNSPDCIEPPVFVEPDLVETDEGMVLVIKIPSSSQVHNHAGRIYFRDHENDIDITDNQQRLSELYQRKRTLFTETKIYSSLTINDLDEELFEKARKLIKANRSDHPWLYLENEELLRESILYRKDFQTGEEGLTLAAALIFGKDSTIQSLLPAYKVEGMVRRENIDRWDDRITLRTNLIETYQKLKEFVYKHLPEKFHMEGDQRIDLRDVIFREVIGNAIVHREYTSALSTDLIISTDDVTITNPNKALFHGPLDPSSFNPYPKNPNIRKFFTSFGWTDEIGSGVRNTNKWLPRYVPNATPIFIEDDVFKTIIPLKVAQLGDFANKLRSWLDIDEQALPHLEEGLKHVALPSSVIDVDWKQLILHLVPSWHNMGTKLNGLKWVSGKASTKEEIQEVPSWTQKGTKLLQKRNTYYIQILLLTSNPIALDEMMRWIGYKNRATFRRNYLETLESIGFVSKTIPDVPNSPDQKYQITERGKLFLAGHNIKLG